jgi:membrane protein implicated in regulation of membrane protease activity
MAGGIVRFIYLSVAVVIAGAALILVATYVIGSLTLQNLGTLVAFLGVLLYVIGRAKYRKAKNSPARSDQR